MSGWKWIWGVMAVSLMLPAPSGALAYDYRVPILVSDEDDLEELAASGDITLEEKDQLLRMLERPLDLNRAARDRLYNLPTLTYPLVDAILEERKKRPFDSVEDLARVPGITKEMIEQIEAFVKVTRKREEKIKRGAVKGSLRVQAVDRIRKAKLKDGEPDPRSPADTALPEAYVRLRAKADNGIEAGVAVITENTIGEVKYREDRPYDSKEDRPQLETSGETYLPTFPKAYFMMEQEKWQILVGSYRVGFGQRAVLDTTGQQNPYGFEPDLFAYVGYKSAKFPTSGNLLGVAGSYTGFEFGGVRLDASFFASYAWNDLYYTRLHQVDPEGLAEPSSYVVISKGPEGEYESLWNIYPTIPRVYVEKLAGGNITIDFGGKSHVGFTAYAAHVDFQIGDQNATFARSDVWPERKEVFVAGGDLAWGTGFATIFGEVAGMDNGAFAGVGRVVIATKGLEVEPSFRYLGDEFDNPHSGIKSQDELLDGNRDRGERGGGVSIRYRPLPGIRLRLDQDIWKATVWEKPQEGEIGDPRHDDEVKHFPLRSESVIRVDVSPFDKLTIGGYASWVDKDLDRSGREESYAGRDGDAGHGEKWKVGGLASTTVLPFTKVKGMYNRSYVDEGKGQFSREHYGVVELHFFPLGFVTSRLEKVLSLSVRGKFFEGTEESFGELSNEKYYEGYVQIAGKPLDGLALALRGALRDNEPREDRYGKLSEKPTEYFWKAVVDWEF